MSEVRLFQITICPKTEWTVWTEKVPILLKDVTVITNLKDFMFVKNVACPFVFDSARKFAGHTWVRYKI